jgi:hypothetical protein
MPALEPQALHASPGVLRLLAFNATAPENCTRFRSSGLRNQQKDALYTKSEKIEEKKERKAAA